ncbi:hypothetical protein Tco_1280760 [Tanacetum coccineum]
MVEREEEAKNKSHSLRGKTYIDTEFNNQCVQTLFYARKDILDHHLPKEWELARDAEPNPFKDILVFRKMVKFLGIIPINLKGNMWELEELVENPINWDRSPKEGDGA